MIHKIQSEKKAETVCKSSKKLDAAPIIQSILGQKRIDQRVKRTTGLMKNYMM